MQIIEIFKALSTTPTHPRRENSFQLLQIACKTESREIPWIHFRMLFVLVGSHFPVLGELGQLMPQQIIKENFDLMLMIMIEDYD